MKRALYKNVIYFAHGKETGPEATKIRHLAAIAIEKGFHVESPDYSQIADPDERVEKLLGLAPHAEENLVLVGSSMGAYVSTVASERLKPRGLLLLAPAFFVEGYRNQNPVPVADITVAVHAWNDEVIPVENVFRFARQHSVQLTLVDSDHRLLTVLPQIGEIFALFLDHVLAKR